VRTHGNMGLYFFAIYTNPLMEMLKLIFKEDIDMEKEKMEDIEIGMAAMALHDRQADTINLISSMVSILSLLVGIKTENKKVKKVAFGVGIFTLIDQIRCVFVSVKKYSKLKKMLIDASEDALVEAMSLKNIGDRISIKDQFGLK
jgi:hypothetical protein